MSDCLFCLIASGDIPADVIHAEVDLVAFRDISPQAPVHFLVIPRAHFANAAEMSSTDPALAGRMLALAGELADREDVAESGYRIVTNTGEQAGQSVGHVHLHVLGGRDLTWPPG